MLQTVTTQLRLSTAQPGTQTGLLLCCLFLLIWKHLPGHCLHDGFQQGRRQEHTQGHAKPQGDAPLHRFVLSFLKSILRLLMKTCCFSTACRTELKSLQSDCSSLTPRHASPGNLGLSHSNSLPLLKKCRALAPRSLCVSACAVPSAWNAFICSLCSPPHLYLPSFHPEDIGHRKRHVLN